MPRSNPNYALAQEQPIAAEAPALGDDHAFRAAFGDLDLGGDGVGLVQDIGRSAGRHAGQSARIGEDRSSRRQARARRIPARERRVVERQHVVLLRLEIEEGLHLLELLRHLGGQVVGLGGVLLDVIELPLVPGDHIRRRGGAQLPRERRRGRARHPPVVIDGAIAEHLEVLRRVPGRGVGVRLVPGVHHAHAFDGALLDAVDRIGRRDAGRFEDGRDDVDDVMELAADAAHVLDVAGPGHGHALGRPAEVRRHLLHPLERRVHRPRPGRRKVREGPVGPPELVPEELVLDRHGNAIEGGELVRRAVEHAFGARAVVAADVDDQGVVELRRGLRRPG